MPCIDLFSTPSARLLPATGRRVVEDLDQSARHGGRMGTVRRNDMTLAWTFGEQRLSDVCRPDVLKVSVIGSFDREALTEFARAVLEDEQPPRIPLKHLAFMNCSPEVAGALHDLHFRKYHIGANLILWHDVTGQKQLL